MTKEVQEVSLAQVCDFRQGRWAHTAHAPHGQQTQRKRRFWRKVELPGGVRGLARKRLASAAKNNPGFIMSDGEPFLQGCESHFRDKPCALMNSTE